MAGHTHSRNVTLLLLRRAQHVLFGVLLLVGCVRTLIGGGPPAWPVIAATLALAAWYGVGIGLARRAPLPGYARAWIAVLVAGWIGVSALSPDFVWLAFALFLLAMQLLPGPAGPVTVAALTAVAVLVSAWHTGYLTAASVLGPVIGATVAVVIMIVYRGLAREVDTRNRLLEQLSAAQDRLAAAERRAGSLDERQRLADEIHDTITQSLSTVLLLLRTAEGQWRDAPAAARGPLDDAVSATRSALDDTRRLIRALEPAAGETPLAAALSQLVDQSTAAGLAARLTVEGEPYPLPTPVEVALLRAGQEALSNVRSHAAADRVEVTLTFLPDSVRLDVADDGHGFSPSDPRSATTGTAVGLDAMRRRLAEVAGRLDIESSPAGTALSVAVPAQKEAR